MADPGFKICQKWQENAFFWHLHVPIRSLERGIGKETDIHMMNTQVVRQTTFLWVQNTAKSALKSTLFCIPFQITPSRAVFYSPWIALGTLVVINNDEWDHFEAFSTLSSPFNAPFWRNRVVFSAHGARARVGSRGSSVGPKTVQKYFFQICS